MKFKKKLIPVLALLLCALTVFASCGSEPKALKIDEEIIKTSRIATSFNCEALPATTEGFQFVELDGNLALFKKYDSENSQTEYRVINIKTNVSVATMTITDDERSENAKSIYVEGGLIVKYENKTYTLCDVNGESIGSAKTEPEFFETAECAMIGELVYVYDWNTFEKKDSFEYSKLNGELPNARLYGDYRVLIYGNGFTVYDAKFNYLGEYNTFTNTNSESEAYVLKNGNVLIQTVTLLPSDADDYDCFVSGYSPYKSYGDGAKYKVETKLVSPKDLKEKKLDFNYIIEYVYPFDPSISDYLLFKGEIDNMVIAYRCVDKQKEENVVMLSLSNSGKVENTIFDGYDYFEPLGNGYLKCETKNGNYVILDAKLNVVFKAVPGFEYTEKYIVTDDAIYDYNKAKLADLVQDSITYEYYDTVGNNIIFTAEDDEGNNDYYLYNGAFNKIADASENQSFDNVGYSSYFYMVTTVGDSAETTVIYDSNGIAKQSFDKSVSFKGWQYNNRTEIIILESDGNYYRLVAAK